MAAEALVIKVSATGVRQVQRDLDSIGKSGARAATGAANTNAQLGKLSKNAAGVRQISTGLTTVATAAGAGAVASGKLTKGLKTTTTATKGLQSSASGLRTTFLALGGALVFTAAIRSIASFEQSMAAVKAITGSTDAEFKKLEKTARTLGATTIFTATQAAEGLKFLSLAGLEANEAMSALPGTLQLAQAGALDLGRAADIASNVLTGFTLAAEDMARVSDVLATAQARSNTNVSQLGEALKLAAPAANAFGVSLEDTVAIIGKLGDAGIQGTLAGTGLRRILVGLADDSNKTTKTLARFGLTMADVNVETRGLIPVLETLNASGIDAAGAFDLLGQRGGTAFLAIRGAIPDLARFSKLLQDAAGNGALMAKIMGATLAGAFKTFKSALNEVTLGLGDAGLKGALTGILNSAAAVILIWSGLGDEFIKANQLTKEQAQGFQDLADRLQKLGSFLIAATGLWVGYKVQVFAATRATALFGAALRRLPLVALVVAVGLAVDALITFGRETEEIQGVAVSGWQKIGAAIGVVKDVILGTVKSIVDAFKSIGAAIAGALNLGPILAKFSELSFSIGDVMKFILRTITGAFGAITSVVPEILRVLPGLVKNIFINLAVDAVGVLERMTNTVIREFNKVREFFGKDPLAEVDFTIFEKRADDSIAKVGAALREGWEQGQRDTERLWQGIAFEIIDAMAGIEGAYTARIQAIIDKANEAAEGQDALTEAMVLTRIAADEFAEGMEAAGGMAVVLEQGQNAANDAVAAAPPLFEAASVGATNFYQGLGDSATRIAGVVQSGFGLMRDTMVNFFETGTIDAENFFGSLRSLAANFFADELITLVSGGESVLLSFFTTTAEAATVSQSVITEGSTTMWEGIRARTIEGGGVVQTVWDAISTGATTLWSNVTTVAGAAWDFITGGSQDTQTSVNNDFGAIQVAGTSMFNGLTSDSETFWDGFQRLAGAAGTFLLDIWDRMRNGALSFIGDVGGSFNSFFNSVAGGLQRFAGAIPGIIGGAISALGGSIGRAVDTGIGLVRGAIRFIGNLFADGGKVEGFAGGGKIKGPGTGTSDSIPAFAEGSPIAVSNGEFIINAASTKKFGGLIQAINDNNVPGFRDGGFHGGPGDDSGITPALGGIGQVNPTFGGPGDESGITPALGEIGLPFQRLRDAQEAARQRVRDITATVVRVLATILSFFLGGPLGAIVGILGSIGSSAIRQGDFSAETIGRGIFGAIPGIPGLGAAGLLGLLDGGGPDFRALAANNNLSFEGVRDGVGSGRDSFTPEGNQFRSGVVNIAAVGRDRLGSSLSGSLGTLAGNTNSILGRDANLPLINAPGRRHGGSVTGGRPYVVGEAGPELFVPGSSGAVVPGGGGSDDAVVQAINRNTQAVEALHQLIAPTERIARSAGRGGGLAGRMGGA